MAITATKQRERGIKMKINKNQFIDKVAIIVMAYSKGMEVDYGLVSIDISLHVHGDWRHGEWSLRTSDARYDLDQRGYWGYSTITSDLDHGTAKEIATDLIDQCLDSQAEAMAN